MGIEANGKQIILKPKQHSLWRLKMKFSRMKIRYFIAHYMVTGINFLHRLNQEIISVTEEHK